MIGLIVTALLLVAANAQYIAECPPENIEVATYRSLTRGPAPIGMPYVERMNLDLTYAVSELQDLLAETNFTASLELPPWFETEPFVFRCCPRDGHAYNCTHQSIQLRYVKYRDGICWAVWPEHCFYFTRCTCCTCVISGNCPVVGRCVETDYETVRIIAYCPHISYNDRFQKLAIRLPSSCRCAASCPAPQDYRYKKPKVLW